jgi:hypothetical protein
LSLKIVFDEIYHLDYESTVAMADSPDKQLPRLPMALQTLHVSGTSKSPIKCGELPPSLQRLTTDLEKGIDVGVLPESLTHLSVGYVSYSYLLWKLPTSLQYLKLYLGNKWTSVNKVSAFIASLPDSLETLHITSLMPRVKVYKWPASLRSLYIDVSSTVSYNLSTLCEEPKMIEKHRFRFAPFPATFESLHIGLAKQPEWCTSERAWKLLKLNVYRFTDGQDRITVDKFDGRTLELHRLLQ